MNKEIIIAIKRDNLDRIVEFKTNNNKIYNYEMAKEAIIKGIIENAKIIKGKDDLFYIAENNSNFEKMEEF
jgi:hypothetical protein